MDTSAIPLVSADAHVNEPRRLWWDALPASMRDRAPARIRPSEEGAWELRRHEQTTLTQRQADAAEEAARNEQNDLAHRLAVMREDGINAECVFPTIGLYVWEMDDAALGEACCQIYNDWIFDTLESKSPRHRCAGMIPTWDMAMALRELRRIADLGLGSAMLPLRGVPEEYNSPHWEPFWEAVEECGLPVVLHQGSGHDMLFYRGPGAAVANLLATQSMAPRSAALLTTSGALERHPGLHVVFVETNAAWLSWAMDTLDSYYDAFLANPGWVRPELAEKPSHYLRRQVHGTFQWDPTGIHNIDRTGTGPLLWGSDYPHSEGTYPHSRAVVQEQFGHLAEADAAAILGGNATRLFGFDPAVVGTPVPDPDPTTRRTA
ncbi:amidohydrolase family protein [Trujillonella endophytica]|uniref:Predicted metal-dependent hydrolase, TIM-barrel fold n=1 Tax=Trujillonella endophytica TaxID=673521 RepID=A0A1H8PHU7_9ACTN|nr:amidohydrolase family protein [Trujillella endophytica]SEO41123.1 Predicted metal-dependent hydrolase, TIM-barrel fold [Trujillella endophytica]